MANENIRIFDRPSEPKEDCPCAEIVGIGDGEALKVRGADAAPDDGEGAAPMFPELIDTVLGKKVKMLAQPNGLGTLPVSYSGGVQGSAIISGGIGDVSALMQGLGDMINGGFLDDEDDNEVSALVLPIDGFELPNNADCRGVIIDCDLRSYVNGFYGLLGSANCASISVEGALSAICEFLTTLLHLQRKEYYLCKLDGHQMFFNAEYGVFRIVIDGVDAYAGNDISSLDEYGRILAHSISAIVMRLITGAWPIDYKNEMLTGADFDNGEHIYFEDDTDEIVASDGVMRVWEALPTALRNALYGACLSKDMKDVTLEEWITVFEEAKKELEECAFCGNIAFRSAGLCLHCGSTTKRDALMTKWAVKNDANGYYLRFSFGRGTVLSGEVLGIQSGFKPFMSLMYSAKANRLGLKNMSSAAWRVTVDGVATSVAPGGVAAVCGGMIVEPEEYIGLVMEFLGYETE